MKPFSIVVCLAALVLTCLRLASAAAPKLCEGCNYAQAALGNSDFTNGVLIATNFKGATLSGSSFRGARLIAVNFEKADLRNSHFDSADCVACNFGDAILDGATFSNVRMVAANFKGFSSSVDDAQLRQLLGGCISCNFSEAHLAARDLSGVSLISVDLSQADLRGTNFAGAVLCWYQGAGAQRVAACSPMHDAITTGANFAGAQLCDNPLGRIGCVPAPADALQRSSGPKPSASPESP
jgi:uncharacterized protein YjbI with pentapeptide repeats